MSGGVALAPLTVGRPAPEVLVTAAAAAGFAQVGLTLWVPGGAPSPLCASPPAAGQLRTTLEAAGVGVLDVGVVVLSPALDLDRVAALAGTGRALGADRVLVIDADPRPARAVAGLRAVCDLAGQAGLQVVLEFMPYSACRTLAEAAGLLAATDVPHAGLVVDLLHLVRSGGAPADLAGLDPGAVRLVQLCDARRQAPPVAGLRTEALTDRCYPGEGGLPLAELLAAVPAGTPLTVEAPVARDAHRSAADRARAAAAALHRLDPVRFAALAQRLSPGR